LVASCQWVLQAARQNGLNLNHVGRLVGGLPFENLIEHIRLGLRLLNKLIPVMGRAIDRISLEGIMPRTDLVVIRASGHDNAVAGAYLVGRPSIASRPSPSTMPKN